MFHAADGDVHPDRRDRDDREHQHEAAGPDAGQVIHDAETDRQDEAAEATDHADEPTDCADVVRVVDRDVLVDGGLAEAHDETQSPTGRQRAEHRGRS